MSKGIVHKIKGQFRYFKTLTGAYERKIAKQDRLLETSSKWILGYERAIQNAQILVNDFNNTEKKSMGKKPSIIPKTPTPILCFLFKNI